MPTREQPTTVPEWIEQINRRLRALEGRQARLPAAAGTFTGDHGSLAGLTDNDHPQYETPAGSQAKVNTHAAGPDAHHPSVHTRAQHTSAIEIQDEGVDEGDVAVLDFAGAGVSVAVVGDKATVTVGSAGHTIKEDGTPLTTRTGLNFVAGLVATDDAGSDETDVNADYATTEIADVAAAEGPGVSNKLPRGDHAHAHGSGYLPDAHHSKLHAADHAPAGVDSLDGTYATDAALAAHLATENADHGLEHADLNTIGANDHHNQSHTQTDHTSATTAEIADVAAAESAGVSSTTPRGDHAHAHGSGYLPNAHHAQAHTSADHDTAETGDLAAVAAAAAAGSNPEVPFADHVHAHGSGYLPNAHHNQAHTSADHDTAETGDLAAVAAAAASGSNPEVPFADHVHAHGTGYLPDAHHTQSHGRSDHTTAVAVSDEGVGAGDALTLNFVGAGVTASVAAGVATVTIAGGGGGSGDEPSAVDWMAL